MNEETLNEVKEHFKGREDELHELIKMHKDFPYQEFEIELIKFYKLFHKYGGINKISFEIIKVIIGFMHKIGDDKENIKENIYSVIDFYFRKIDK